VQARYGHVSENQAASHTYMRILESDISGCIGQIMANDKDRSYIRTLKDPASDCGGMKALKSARSASVMRIREVQGKCTVTETLCHG